MRRVLLASVVVLGTAALAVPTAFAASPHFAKPSPSSKANVDGSLTASFKEAGVGRSQDIAYSLTADATAVWVCFQGGGANQTVGSKTTVAGAVSTTGTFTSAKNGSITAAITVLPPMSDQFTCPLGQSLELASAGYTSVTLTDTSNSVVAALGDASTGCLLPGIRGAC